MAEPVTNMAMIAKGAFTDSLTKKKEKVVTRIKKSNSHAASGITRIIPQVKDNVIQSLQQL